MITKQEFLTTIAPAGHSIEWFSENVCHCVVCGCLFLLGNTTIWMSIDGREQYHPHAGELCKDLVIKSIIK